VNANAESATAGGTASGDMAAGTASRARATFEKAIAGVLAVGAALAIGELAAGLVPGIPSPLLSIAKLIVDLQPPGAKDLVVALFGTNDKLALEIFIVIVALLVGGALGILAWRGRRGIATAVIAVFAAVGFIASTRDPDAVAALAALAALAEVVAGSWALGWVLALPSETAAGGQTSRGVAASRNPQSPRRKGSRTAASPARPGGMPDWTRRTLLIRGGAIGIASIGAAAIGRSLLERQHAAPVGTLPQPAVPLNLPPGADVSTAGLTSAGLSPIVVPNDDFYRIDTAFVPPDVDRSTWKLTVKGLVDREVDLTWDELAQLPIVEQYVTIACVSNEVGGNLVGNALWRGIPLRTVLDMAGVKPEADQLIGRAVDGFTVGMPVAWVQDKTREPLIAIGMNGQPLPRLHGYPARLIVPGLYGYVSATKWLSELELSRFDQFDSYWVRLGWAQQAPILTQSRIDVPRSSSSIPAGRTTVAGVAWAPDRGISKVEVSIDGQWQTARLSAPISKATWVQWLLDWDAPLGQHELKVRATDGQGQLQSDQESPPFPDGARGFHRILVTAHD
jgi:DMSO/TMAO reductase YedYZ molybdopterin-dependent catalytic subunit